MSSPLDPRDCASLVLLCKNEQSLGSRGAFMASFDFLFNVFFLIISNISDNKKYLQITKFDFAFRTVKIEFFLFLNEWLAKSSKL